MWFLNYCAPIYYRENEQINSFRYILYSQVLFLFIIYVIKLLLYRIFGQKRLQKQIVNKQPIETRKNLTAFNFASQDHWISSKDFKQWYLNYFSLHSVAIGIAIMYAPYLPQIIFAILHAVLFTIATALLHFKKQGVTKYIFNIVMVVSNILNIALLFSGSMGVGASGYDENEKICLLQASLV